jgi:5-(carboxyamino)imidazole ribonucleotide mutase
MMNKIAIIMGSDSDLPVMQAAVAVLSDFGISCETTIVSAHRTPDRLVQFAKNAANDGFKVIIAGAGGAAHLPGMVASFTTLPVIGVPIKSSTMSGIDSLYSIVQMPPGVPVATVAINGAKNAGILAAQILAISDVVIAKRVAQFKQAMEQEVLDKAVKLESLGPDAYLKDTAIG